MFHRVSAGNGGPYSINCVRSKTKNCVWAMQYSFQSADEEDPDLLPPSTAPLRLEESGRTKRTCGKTMDFMALHTGVASKKGKP